MIKINVRISIFGGNLFEECFYLFALILTMQLVQIYYNYKDI